MSLLHLVWRNSFRNKSRFILTCLSVLVAFFLFSVLAGINHALSSNVSSNNQYRLLTSHKISMTRALPRNYQQKISAIAGVEEVSYSSWFGGFLHVSIYFILQIFGFSAINSALREVEAKE